MVTLLMVLTAQHIGAVNHNFQAYTTIEWCMSSQIIGETRGAVAVVTETCMTGCESVDCCSLSILITSCVFDGFETENRVPD